MNPEEILHLENVPAKDITEQRLVECAEAAWESASRWPDPDERLEWQRDILSAYALKYLERNTQRFCREEVFADLTVARNMEAATKHAHEVETELVRKHVLEKQELRRELEFAEEALQREHDRAEEELEELEEHYELEMDEQAERTEKDLRRARKEAARQARRETKKKEAKRRHKEQDGEGGIRGFFSALGLAGKLILAGIVGACVVLYLILAAQFGWPGGAVFGGVHSQPVPTSAGVSSQRPAESGGETVDGEVQNNPAGAVANSDAAAAGAEGAAANPDAAGAAAANPDAAGAGGETEAEGAEAPAAS